MIDNKPNGFHLTGSMGVWDQLPGTAQAQKGSVVGLWWGGAFWTRLHPPCQPSQEDRACIQLCHVLAVLPQASQKLL